MPSTAMQNRAMDCVVRRIAAAKINLYLHITGRRADGYHCLDSMVAFAAIGDLVTAAPAGKISLRIEGPMAAGLALSMEDNLVYRAACALADAAGVDSGAALTLVKHLPVASGLGGGSADAAAALQALRVLWNLSINDDELKRIGLALGADVPVCLGGRATVMTGVGEKLDDLAALPDCHLVLVNPGVAVSTATVFAGLAGGATNSPPPVGAFSDMADFLSMLEQRGNDLEAPATWVAPVISQVLESLRADPACRLARMSGSGATCFGLYEDEASAVICADQILLAHPEWWVTPTRLVDDTESLQAWAA